MENCAKLLDFVAGGIDVGVDKPKFITNTTKCEREQVKIKKKNASVRRTRGRNKAVETEREMKQGDCCPKRNKQVILEEEGPLDEADSNSDKKKNSGGPIVDDSDDSVARPEEVLYNKFESQVALYLEQEQELRRS